MASGVAILAWEEDVVELTHHRVGDSVEIKKKSNYKSKWVWEKKWMQIIRWNWYYRDEHFDLTCSKTYWSCSKFQSLFKKRKKKSIFNIWKTLAHVTSERRTCVFLKLF